VQEGVWGSKACPARRFSRRDSFGGEALHDLESGEILRGVAAVPARNVLTGPKPVALVPRSQRGDRDAEAPSYCPGAQAVIGHPTAPLASPDS
jgi:hypothetical protein